MFQKASQYDQERPESQTTDQPTFSYLIVLTLSVKVFLLGPCFIMYILVPVLSVSFFFAIILRRKKVRERAGCFNLIVFLLPCGCLGSLLFFSSSSRGWIKYVAYDLEIALNAC